MAAHNNNSMFASQQQLDVWLTPTTQCVQDSSGSASSIQFTDRWRTVVTEPESINQSIFLGYRFLNHDKTVISINRVKANCDKFRENPWTSSGGKLANLNKIKPRRDWNTSTLMLNFYSLIDIRLFAWNREVFLPGNIGFNILIQPGLI